MKNKHKSQTVVVFTSSLHELQDFRLNWGCSKVMFRKISLKNLPYLTDFSQAPYMNYKTLDSIGGVPKRCLGKSPLKICLISQILVHSLWHVCINHFIHLSFLPKYLNILSPIFSRHRVQLTLVISTSFISNNRLSGSENLVPA